MSHDGKSDIRSFNKMKQKSLMQLYKKNIINKL